MLIKTVSGNKFYPIICQKCSIYEIKSTTSLKTCMHLKEQKQKAEYYFITGDSLLGGERKILKQYYCK